MSELGMFLNWRRQAAYLVAMRCVEDAISGASDDEKAHLDHNDVESAWVALLREFSFLRHSRKPLEHVLSRYPDLIKREESIVNRPVRHLRPNITNSDSWHRHVFLEASGLYEERLWTVIFLSDDTPGKQDYMVAENAHSSGPELVCPSSWGVYNPFVSFHVQSGCSL